MRARAGQGAEPVSPSATMRSVRNRVGTPWVPSVVFADEAAGAGEGQHVRVAAGEEVEEVERSPTATLRPSRERMATPWVPSSAGREEADEEGRHVQVEEQPHSIEVVEVSSSSQMRSARNRMATPWVANNAVSADETAGGGREQGQHVRVAAGEQVEEVERSPTASLRPSRDRMATPWVPPSVDREEADGEGHHVQVEDTPHSIEVVEVSPSSHLRPARNRMATPWVPNVVFADEDAAGGREQGQHVRVAAGEEVEEVERSPSAALRPSRGRMATPWVPPSAGREEAGDEGHRVQVEDRPDSVEVVEVSASSQMRSARNRMATPWVASAVSADGDAVGDGERGPHFQAAVGDEVEEVERSPTATLRPSRDRMATPWVPRSAGRDEADDEGHHVQVEDEPDSVQVVEVSPSSQMRSARNRMATPWVPNVAFADEDAAGGREQGQRVRVATGEEVEEVERSPRASLRPSRERMATPWVPPHADREEADEEDQHVRVEDHPDSIEVVEVSPSSKMRSARNRMATPWVPNVVFADEAPAGGREQGQHVQVAAGEDVEEVERSPTATLRPSRERMATPWVPPSAAREEADEEGHHVQVDDRPQSVEVVEVSASSQMRSARNRMATPWVTNGVLPDGALTNGREEEGQQVRFARVGDAEEVERSPTATLRPSRERMATPWVPLAAGRDDASAASAADEDGHHVQMADGPHSTEVVEVDPSSQMRSARNRMATPWVANGVHTDDPADGGEEPGRHVRVAAGEQVEEVERSPRARLRPSRERMATPWVPPPAGRDEAEEEGHHVQVQEEPQSVDVVEVSPSSQMRSARNRMATPWVPNVVPADETAGREQGPQVRVAAGEEVEEVERSPGSTLRPSRERMATPWVPPTAAGKEADEEVHHVQVEDQPNSVEVVEVSPSSNLRTLRNRMATPWAKDLPKGKAVTFDDAGAQVFAVRFAAEEEAAEELERSPTASFRPSRDRMATPWIFPGAALAEDTDQQHVQVVAEPEVVQEVEVSPSSTMRSSRSRMSTPWVTPDVVVVDRRQLQLAVHDQVEEVERSPTSNLRPSRERMATPWIPPGQPPSDDAEAEPEPEHQEDPRFRVAEGAPTVEEVEVSPSSNLRSSRQRMATPWVTPAAQLDDGPHVQLVDAPQVVEEVEVSPSSQMRSARQRMATPWVPAVPANEAAAGGREQGHTVRVATGDVVEEVERSPDATMRPSRERMATPWVARAADREEEEDEDSHRVQIEDGPQSIEVVEVDQASNLRSLRSRMATPWAKPTDVPPSAGKAVTFDNAGAQVFAVRFASEEATEELERSPTANFRPSRDRMATPWISPGAALAEDTDQHVQVAAAPEAVEEVEVSPSSTLRSSRSRMSTPWVTPDVVTPDSRQLQLAVDDQVEEVERSADSTLRPSRERMATPWVAVAASDDADEDDRSRVQVSESPQSIEEVQVSPASNLRSFRNRMATPWTKKEDLPDTPAFGKSVSFSDVVDEDDIEVAMLSPRDNPESGWLPREDGEGRDRSTNLRHCRDRMATQWVPPGAAVTAEEDLEKHRVPGAVKDKALLKGTLQRLSFFEEFEDEALEELADMMEAFEFQDGEKAVRQGDTDGTHFFVVAEGEFIIVKDGSPKCSIRPGDYFGESVLLLYGERTASVVAAGRALAFGMEGMAVRDLLKTQYERKRASIIQAVDEVLSSHACEMLSKLNAYQLQMLYDQVEMRSYTRGDILLREGKRAANTPSEVLVLFSGPVIMRAKGVDLHRLERFGMAGDRAIVFQEQATTLVAEGPVQVLVLKAGLLESIFGEQLPQVLVRQRVLGILAHHQVFSRLHEEQREAVAGACQIRTLLPGEELVADDLRFAACLHGEVETRLLNDGSQPEIRRYSGADWATFAEENLLRRGRPWPILVRAPSSSSSVAKLAVWRNYDLDNILTFDDLDVALEQEDKVRVLKSVVLFRTLSKLQLQRLAGKLEIQHDAVGARVVEQGSSGTHFYIIRRGLVQVEIDGRKIRTLGMGDYFGERALLLSELRTASVIATEATELWKMGKETFEETMQGPCLHYLKDRIQLQDTQVTMQDLEFLRVIGRGGFGVVKMVRHRVTGHRYALKCVRKRDIVERGQKEALNSERSILLEVDHPFIIKCVRSFSNARKVYFLTELVCGGELLDVLELLGLLNHRQAQFYTGSILLALEFLHARRIAYLDLKAENCLIDHQGYLKLIDFGIAQRITSAKCHVVKGTPRFMAPEMIRGKGYTTVADLWSLGICLYEFVVGDFPFVKHSTANHGQIFQEILLAELKFPAFVDGLQMGAALKSLVRGLLTRDPARRLGAGFKGFDAIKGHEFFRGLDWDALLGRELRPPYVPTGERYAEDKEKERGGPAAAGERPMLIEEEEALNEGEDTWVDPSPGWDAEF